MVEDKGDKEDDRSDEKDEKDRRVNPVRSAGMVEKLTRAFADPSTSTERDTGEIAFTATRTAAIG
jgi:hypothetical protein